MNYCIGVDLGGTNIAVGLVDRDSKSIVQTKSCKTNAPRACESVSADIAELCHAVCRAQKIELSDVDWIGVGTPGIVKGETVISAHNLGWRDVPFGKILSSLTSRPVHIANDANAAAFAEAVWGVGRNYSSLIAITLGTGVGGGVVINGKIWDGFNGFAAEIGHMVIFEGGRECGCGNRGCLEAYCSATALVRETKRMMNLYPDSAMWRFCGGDINRVNGKTAFLGKAADDYAARVVLDSFIDHLSVGISNLINVFQPSVICIGGGLSREGDNLLVPLCDRVSRISFGLKQGRTKVVCAQFKNDAGIIGASLLGLQQKERANMRKSEIVVSNFNFEGEVEKIEPHGNGHINRTNLVTARVNGGERRYVLQRINKTVFRDPEALMKNYAKVTAFLHRSIVENGGDPNRETLNLVKTIDDKDYYIDDEGEYWRMVDYVVDSVSYDKVESPEQFYDSAVAFGNFQYLLRDYPAEELIETIPNFHNTPDRYEQFLRAVAEDKCSRLSEVKDEVEFVKAHREFAETLERAHKEGRLPLRVTHNDTKLNNILFDKDSGKPICIIDLDTIMPGYSVNDFGDSIRFGATTALEDETDLSKVNFDIEFYELYLKGFIEGANGGLTKSEIELLPIGALMMTFECGMRFLTDYLNGDVYFKIHREKHNLDRARNQFKLLSDMEKRLDEMKALVEKYV
ncbi:MAG: ROK family protein [Clostridia bacterium]|nr:ROK family protein [Clostridia bacterium]